MDPESSSRTRVFLSYSHADPNAEVVRAVHTALTDYVDVYCDLDLHPGESWPATVESKIAETDYFVVFLSQEAVRSDPVAGEARLAVKLHKETRGRPRIVPVLLAYDIEELGVQFEALRNHNAVVWQDPEDTREVIDQLQREFTGEWVAPRTETAPALSRHLMSATRNKRIREVFVAPPDVDEARTSIRSGRVLWITGKPGAGKQFLATALACELEKPVFELRRTVTWRHIFEHRPAESVLLLPDALALERAGAMDYESGLKTLRLICETDNVILLTCTDEEYAARSGQLIDAEFSFAQLTKYPLADDAYSPSLRTAIVRKLVQQNHAARFVSAEQQQWILDAGRTSWDRWTLSEIESFVTRSLPAARSSAEVKQLLDRPTTILEQVHTWFLGQDEAARSLLLALLLFPDASPQEIWTRFKAILSSLEQCRLIPQVAVPALGVARARAAPYVTQTGDLEIVDPGIATAIARELALSWREYVLELRPLLIEWALPPEGQDRATTRKGTDESAAVRRQLGRLLGEFLSVRLEDVLGFFDDFWSHGQRAVRQTAAEAIVHAFHSEDGARNGQKLLRTLEANRSGDDAVVRRREVAADACCRIVAIPGGSTNYGFALEQMHRYTRDLPRIRSAVAGGLKIINRQNFRELRPFMTRLAADQNEIVRRRVGTALNQLSRHGSDEADALYTEWLSSDNSNRLWTAAFSLLVGSRARRDDHHKLRMLMQRDATAFASALVSAIKPGDEIKDADMRERALPNLRRLATEPELRDWCATTLGAFWLVDSESGGDLCKRLGDLADSSIDELLVHAYQQRAVRAPSFAELQQMVLEDVKAAGTRRKIATLAVALSLDELIEEDDSDPIRAAWENAPESFERFLIWLQAEFGNDGYRAVIVLRRLTLQSLLRESKKLVKLAATWLKKRESSAATTAAIQTILADTEWWARLAAPLTFEFWDSHSDVELILEAFDSRSSRIVRQLAFTRLLDEHPRKFVGEAIDQTKETRKFRSEVLIALAEMTKEQSPEMIAAIRLSASAANRRDVRRLIRDFRNFGPPLAEIADKLFPTRFWLALLDFVSSGDS